MRRGCRATSRSSPDRRGHEKAHVAFLEQALGGAAEPAPRHDFGDKTQGRRGLHGRGGDPRGPGRCHLQRAGGQPHAGCAEGGGADRVGGGPPRRVDPQHRRRGAGREGDGHGGHGGRETRARLRDFGVEGGVRHMDFLLDDLDTDGALREAGENAGISRAAFLGATLAGAVAAFAVDPHRPGREQPGRRGAELRARARVHAVVVLHGGRALQGAAREGRRRRDAASGAVERAHVDAFKELLGRKAIERPAFNFRGTTESERAFLKTAVAFEDLAVAAYKGQAPRLRSKEVLAAALSIHSVEARHAAWMRYLFGVQPAVDAFDDAALQGGDPACGRRDAASSCLARARRRVDARASPDEPAHARRRGDGRRGSVRRGRDRGDCWSARRPGGRTPPCVAAAAAEAGSCRAAPRGLGDGRHVAVWTSVVRRATARARPNGRRPPRRATGPPDAGAHREHGARHRPRPRRERAVWVRARLPVLPERDHRVGARKRARRL